MVCVVVSLAYSLRLVIRSGASLHLEIIALRHQLAVVNRSRAAQTAAQPCRPTAVGVAVAGMARLAHGRPDCQAGDRHRMAPPRLSPVLDLEESRTYWAAGCASRRAHPDPRAVDRESALGCAAASWGASEARDLGQPVHRCQVHAAASPPAVTNVADVPHQPREPDYGR
jgi:hypothetical protein